VFSSHFGLALLISAALFTPSAYASTVHQSSTTGHTSSSRKLAHGKRRTHRERGQQAIEPERVTEIQDALIRAHYLNGDASGKWDSTTIAAMQKYQADHGWQTKLTPDSRALKSLGLGADYSDAINAKGANFNPPAKAGDTPASQTAGFTAGSGVNQ
jgi:hypothetical protein